MLDWTIYVLTDYSFVAYEPEMRVLDVGFGKGKQLQELKRNGCIAFGVEPNWVCLVSGQQRGIRVLQARAERLPVRNASVDGLVCKTVIPYTDERRALREISRVLKAGAVARLCYHGAGYYLRYLLAGPSWKFRFYGFRALFNTWFYAVTGRRLPGYLGDTIYQSRRRLTRYYRENGLRAVGETHSGTFLRFPVFIYHAIRKVSDGEMFAPVREAG